MIEHKPSISEILDALAEALANRNQDKDKELVGYWIEQLNTHRDMLADRRLEE